MDVRAVEALLVRARQKRGRGDVEGARVDLDSALDIEPGHARLRLVRALVLIDQQEFGAAKADVDRVIGAVSGTGTGAASGTGTGEEHGDGVGAAALAVRGWLALHLDGDPGTADEDLSAAIAAGDRQPSTYITRGWARDALGDHSGALEDARYATRLSPLDADARFLTGVSRIHLGDPGGAGDLDRADMIYAATGNQRGRRDVWDMRAAIREAGVPSSGGFPAWLWFGPRPVPGGEDAQGPRPGRVVAIPGGQLLLVALVLGIRYLVTVVAVGVLTVALPGLRAGPPALITVALVTLLYRMLRAGGRALLTSLLFTVPAPVLVRVQVWPLPVVGVLRWWGAAALASGMLAVAAWVTAWFGLHYRITGVWSVIGAAAVLGLGTFVSFPVLRRASQ